MAITFIKATGIWLLMVAGAVGNGLLREKVLSPLLEDRFALPLSGVMLSVLIFVVAYLTIPFIEKSEGRIYVFIGLLWVVLTLSFEFIFGHYGAGKSWREIVEVFDVMNGNLFTLALITSAASPWLAAKIQGLL